MSGSCCPPYTPCPPPPQPPCPQVCPPPPPPPPCRVKPTMRGLHLAQTKGLIIQGIIISVLSGLAYKYLVAEPRINAYAEFHAKSELDEWADEMAKKGLFQAVPKESLSK